MVKQPPPDEPGNDDARHLSTDLDQAKAGKWFERATEFGNLRKYDSAVEYYVNGLGFWPDAVETGLRPLHGCGVAFKQTGGKKPGLKDTMKRSMTTKDTAQALQNSLWLFGHDPDNAGFIEGVLKNANKLHVDDAILWAAGVYRKLLQAEKKPNLKRYMLLHDVIVEAADRATRRGEVSYPISILELGVEAMSGLEQRLNKNREVEKTLRDLSTKLTIVRGRYQEAGSFRDSLEDEESQREIHDRERLVQSDERHDELVLKAQADFDASSNEFGKLGKLIDLLCRRERQPEELQAIGILVAHYKATDRYASKQRADDIRIKQLRRAAREIQKSGDKADVKEAMSQLLRFELKVYADRHEKYPTDLRVLFELGVRLYRAGQFDKAIPLLQRARTDAKNQDACSLYLGRSFYSKGLADQAIETFATALGKRDINDDAIGMELLYRMARAHEKTGAIADARKGYGQLLQFDYNFRDVLARMEALPDVGSTGAG